MFSSRQVMMLVQYRKWTLCFSTVDRSKLILVIRKVDKIEDNLSTHVHWLILRMFHISQNYQWKEKKVLTEKNFNPTTRSKTKPPRSNTTSVLSFLPRLYPLLHTHTIRHNASHVHCRRRWQAHLHPEKDHGRRPSHQIRTSSTLLARRQVVAPAGDP